MQKIITEQELRVFIDAVIFYFNQTASHQAKVLPAYLAEPENVPVSDYSGVIHVSGHFSGTLCFSAPKAMLNSLLAAIGEVGHTEEARKDLVGELANVFSGNVRKHFGDKFIISVPETVEGEEQKDALQHSDKSYVVPVQWKNKIAYIVVHIKRQ